MHHDATALDFMDVIGIRVGRVYGFEVGVLGANDDPKQSRDQ